MTLTIDEQLMHTTVRLECQLNNGGTSTGTGFFFSYKIDESQSVPVIVSNKHVIDGAVSGSFVLTKRSDDGLPIVGSYEVIKIDDFEGLWIKHPEQDVDIAIFPLAPLLTEAEHRGLKVFFLPVTEDVIPNDQTLKSLGGIEDIIMIGYPNGIWDQINNMPIIRRGITATNPKYNYDGHPTFLIDCACFPGSSGSPVFIFNRGGYTDAEGSFVIGGSRIILLGILFAGPQHIAQGEVTTIDVPLQQMHISLSRIPNNLGFVVKSSKLADFRKFFDQL